MYSKYCHLPPLSLSSSVSLGSSIVCSRCRRLYSILYLVIRWIKWLHVTDMPESQGLCYVLAVSTTVSQYHTVKIIDNLKLILYSLHNDAHFLFHILAVGHM